MNPSAPTIELDHIYNFDCLVGLGGIPDNSVDLVVTDPPYEFDKGGGGGAFGSKKRDYHAEYISLYYETGKTRETERLRIMANTQKNVKLTGGRLLSAGFDFAVLDECCRVLRAVNIYVWCSKAQVRKILQYFEGRGCNTDILCWCKTNPTPMCNNTYLSDIEYCIFAREKGVKLYGDYASKHKFWVSKCNVEDKKLWGHPTIKPLDIISQLITNSSTEGQTVLDPFMGSGTTAVACIREKRRYVGFELNEEYYGKALQRVAAEVSQPTLF